MALAVAALIIIGSIFGYCLIGAIVGGKAFASARTAYLDSCSSNNYYHSDPYGFRESLIGVFWPIGLFFLLAVALSDRGVARYKQREADLAERERLLKLGMNELKREGLA